jgi:hypothetical protein
VPEDQPVNEIGGYAEERGKREGDADVVARHGMSQAGSGLQRDHLCPLLTNKAPRAEGQVRFHQPWRAGLSKTLRRLLRQGDAPGYSE